MQRFNQNNIRTCNSLTPHPVDTTPESIIVEDRMAVNMPKAMKFIMAFVFAGEARDEASVYWGFGRLWRLGGMVVEKG
jgi:hypothetical protein